ncbi:MAG: methyltransferase domain-containing protein [Tepidanaerobacteraceae bacterium]|nr:methyltransferase domain-containing protein [Tepidanaerobacteraceae bacterium]
MGDNFVVDEIKKDIEEILEAKRKLMGIKDEINNPAIPIPENALLNEIHWNLENAVSQGNIDINHIPVHSHRPVIGWAITFFKRAVRKSTYWLYEPLFIKLSGFNSLVLNILNKLVKYTEDVQLHFNKQLQEIREERGHVFKKEVDIIEQKMSSLHDLFLQLEEELNKYYSFTTASKEEITNELSNFKELVETYKSEINNDRAKTTDEIENLRKLIGDYKIDDDIHHSSTKEDINKIKNEMKNLRNMVETYRAEAAFLRARLSVLLQQIKSERKPMQLTRDIENNLLVDIDVNKIISTDCIYHTFEHYFRGSEDLIKERQKKYVMDIKKAYDKCGGYILDIGSGRGEFLELCSQEGISAKGVDINDVMVEDCQKKGLDVINADGISYLTNIPDESLCAVTAFQVIEHLTHDQLLSLLQLALLKLKPGGVIILETVNVDSILSLKNFYSDLTHLKPIPPATLRFLLEAVGFKNVDIVYSSPVPDDVKLAGEDENTSKLNMLLFGDQDYAVKGWR